MKNNYTLFHATTDFYLDSIIAFGLGGLNPNTSFGVLDFLRDLYSLCEQLAINDTVYRKIQFSTEGMVSQSIKGAFNFRHDKTYLTINESTAIRYSLNKYGSELLTRCIVLYEILKVNGFEDKINTSKLRIDFNSILKAPHNRILLNSTFRL